METLHVPFQVPYGIKYRVVLRIRDVYPGWRILIFNHPGSKNSNKKEEKTRCPAFVAINITKLTIIKF